MQSKKLPGQWYSPADTGHAQPFHMNGRVVPHLYAEATAGRERKRPGARAIETRAPHFCFEEMAKSTVACASSAPRRAAQSATRASGSEYARRATFGSA